MSGLRYDIQDFLEEARISDDARRLLDRPLDRGVLRALLVSPKSPEQDRLIHKCDSDGLLMYCAEGWFMQETDAGPIAFCPYCGGKFC